MKEIKNIASFLYKKRIFVLSLFFALSVTLHIFWIVKAAGDGKFFLLHEDEVIYYCSGKLFSDTNSLQAEGCIDENVSAIGNMNWYGPGYNVVYGFLFKITGDGSAVIPWFHFVLAMGTLGVIFLLPVTLESRLVSALTLSVTQQFCVYIYTYFPETLILFLASVLTVLLARLVYSDDPRLKRRYLFTFIICTLVFMLCRITFIFWLAALVGLAENRRSLAVMLMIFISGVVLSLVYMKLFIAPAYASSLHKIDLLYNGAFKDFIVQTWNALIENAKAVFVGRTSVINLLLGLIAASVNVYFFTKNKLVLAAILVSFCLLGVMFAYYNVHHFFFIKQTAMIVPLLVVGLVAAARTSAWVYLLPLIFLVTFPSPMKKVDEAIVAGRSGYEHRVNNIAFEKAVAEIPEHIQNKSTVILWCYREYDYGYAAEALLPFATKAREPILYTTNIVEPTADPQAKFLRHNRLKIDYILSRNPLPWPNLKEVHATEYYHLYELTSNQPAAGN